MRAGIIATCFLLHTTLSAADAGRDPRVKLSTLEHNWLDSIGRLEVPVTRLKRVCEDISQSIARPSLSLQAPRP